MVPLSCGASTRNSLPAREHIFSCPSRLRCWCSRHNKQELLARMESSGMGLESGQEVIGTVRVSIGGYQLHTAIESIA